ncbi:alpha-glucosidase [Chitinophaga terrae (ex Kim and Jung 2007)]|uniref:Alpha-glucosidase n=1 Tax=Chitinophaga terrae (ex Kim and Jung 2007) TaxID=408074 RepID=A0A1H3ZFI6_9BACT|nr:alpha-amylase family glycosyl hydrolase [Chitinophaga terrae (ex Kim and Jung 2007)]GEP88731.1 alpha-amylase [Chitinophaga terrae (ex Kim and Jung 2007)]SEA22563.1 alpha-glucosidase [Chitinophaga terrae (ex Kim and Jung 2007)]
MEQLTYWWQTGVIYQIYPRSFQDSDADGVGDLNGIIQRLDYLQWLGINAIWLSPIFPSPMADFGYDVSDYTGIYPLFGTMEDFDRLLKEVHQRNMKLILDFVPNHTSDQHPWFIESKSSRSSAKRDWYLWRNPKEDGTAPNNWRSVFGGSAWEWDENTQQYYYHGFLKEQPDLNWRNPEVQAAMYDVIRFWMNKGVDGFRIDVLWHVIKDDTWPDNPPNPAYESSMPEYDTLLPLYSTDQPAVHEIVSGMRKVFNEYPDRVMIAEVYLPLDKLMAYYGVNQSGAHLPFNFMLLSLPWTATALSEAINSYEQHLPADGWPNWVLGNHDRPRLATRIGREQTPVAALLLLTLRGTPTIYYGEETGMKDVPVLPAETRDPQGLRMPDKQMSRDPVRTPMQWDDSEYAGFSAARPWLPVAVDYPRINVQAERAQPGSLLQLYRRLIALRHAEPSLQLGSYKEVLANHQLLAYIRKVENQDSFLIILNLTHRPAFFETESTGYSGTVVVATEVNREGTEVQSPIALLGDEGLVIRLKK